MHEEPPPGPSTPISRQPDAFFLLALVFALRECGMKVTPTDIVAAAALIRTSDSWPREELSRVLAAVLIRRPGDRALFEETFARLYDQQLFKATSASTALRRGGPGGPPSPRMLQTFSTNGLALQVPRR